MADPLSILGAVAAASQLAAQSLRITVFLCQLTSQIRAAQKNVTARTKQIEELVSISRQIVSNPALQTDGTASVLNLCLHEATELQQVLQKFIIVPTDRNSVRIKKSLKFTFNEKELTRAFENLSRVQGLLVLSIAEHTSSIIHVGFKDTHSSLDPLLRNTSHTVTTLDDSLPAIFAQLASIEQRLSVNLSQNHGRIDSTLKENMVPCVQQAMISQHATKLFPNFASRLTTHYHVPLTRSKLFRPMYNFTPIISTLTSRLTYHTDSNKHTLERTVTLAGVACAGKTQVALEFCNRAREEQYFGAIFCVQASSMSTVNKSFNNIADMLNVPKSEYLDTRIKMVMAILQAWPCPWLLVFDNCKDWSENIDIMTELVKYIPKSEQGSILITRDLRSIQSMGGEVVEGAVVMPDLTLREAVAFLLNRSMLEETDDTYEDGVKLALALEKRPRALKQAGEYIGRHRIGIAEYLKMFYSGDQRTVARQFNDRSRISQ